MAITKRRPPISRLATPVQRRVIDFEAMPGRTILVDFRSGEAVHRHPDLIPLLQAGWEIDRAVPHLAPEDGVKLMVTMSRKR